MGSAVSRARVVGVRGLVGGGSPARSPSPIAGVKGFHRGASPVPRAARGLHVGDPTVGVRFSGSRVPADRAICASDGPPCPGVLGRGFVRAGAPSVDLQPSVHPRYGRSPQVADRRIGLFRGDPVVRDSNFRGRQRGVFRPCGAALVPSWNASTRASEGGAVNDRVVHLRATSAFQTPVNEESMGSQAEVSG